MKLFENAGLSDLFDSNKGNPLLESKAKSSKREILEDTELIDNEIEAISLDFNGEDLQAFMSAFNSPESKEKDSEVPV